MSKKRSNKGRMAEIRQELREEIGDGVLRMSAEEARAQILAAPGAGSGSPYGGGGSGFAPYQGGYVPSMPVAPGEKAYPDMPEVSPDDPNLKEFGAPGTAIFAGIITSEEYNPDLYWREAVRVYEQMRRNDPQIFATMLMCELPIAGAEWRVQPASEDPDHIVQASYAESACFDELEQPWEDVIRQALLMLSFGFMVYEKVFKVDDDGNVWWSKFAPRLPRTIWRWWIDQQNELKGLQQWTYKNYTYQFIDIPREKVIVFTNRQEGNNFEGVSYLRTAYEPWYYKKALLKLMGIGYEREHVGVPVVGLPLGYTGSDLSRAQKIGKNLRSNEESYVTLPPGWTLEWLHTKAGEKKGSSILEALYYMDILISRNVLAQMMNLGSTETGSYALSSDQSAMFLMSEQMTANYVANVFNQDAIKQLVKYNFDDVDMFPKLVCRRIQAFDFESIAASISPLISAGAITNDQGLEDYLRQIIGLPSAPHNPVQATKPNGEIDQTQPGATPTESSSSSGPEQRSKGPGQDATVTASEPGLGRVVSAAAGKLMSEPYRQRLLNLPHRQQRRFLRMWLEMRERQKPYAILSREEFDRRLNRRTPEHPQHRKRVDLTVQRLESSVRRLGAELEKARGER